MDVKSDDGSSAKNGRDYNLYVGNYNRMTYQGDILLILNDEDGQPARYYIKEDVTLAPQQKEEILSLETYLGPFKYRVEFDGHFLPDEELVRSMDNQYDQLNKAGQMQTPVTVYLLSDDSHGWGPGKPMRYDVYLGNYGSRPLSGELEIRFSFQNKTVKEVSLPRVQTDGSEKKWVGKIELNSPVDYYQWRVKEEGGQ